MKVQRSGRQSPAFGPFGRTYLMLLVVGATGVAAIYALLALSQGVSMVRLPTEVAAETSARIELLKLSLASTAGIAAVAGLYVAYRKQRNEEFAAVREQDKVFTERFSSAAQLLESDKAAVRMAGLNAIARLADDSPRDRETCLKTICAYLRLPIEVPSFTDFPSDADSERPEPEWFTMRDRGRWPDPEEWEVRRSGAALLTARLDQSRSEIFWQDGDLDLRNSVLIDFDLSGCTIEGSLDASGAIFVAERGIVWAHFRSEGKVVFLGARFVSPVALVEAVFDGRAYFFAASFQESLFIRSCRFETHLSMGAASVKKKLEVSGGAFSGFITFSQVECGEGLEFRGCDLRLAKPVQGEDSDDEPPSSVEFLDLGRVSIEGGLSIVDCALPPVVNLRLSTISGGLNLQGASAVDLRGANIGGADLGKLEPRAILLDEVDAAADVASASAKSLSRSWPYTVPIRPGEGYQLDSGS